VVVTLLTTRLYVIHTCASFSHYLLCLPYMCCPAAAEMLDVEEATSCVVVTLVTTRPWCTHGMGT
jgi:hypothetical protein